MAVAVAVAVAVASRGFELGSSSFFGCEYQKPLDLGLSGHREQPFSPDKKPDRRDENQK